MEKLQTLNKKDDILKQLNQFKYGAQSNCNYYDNNLKPNNKGCTNNCCLCECVTDLRIYYGWYEGRNHHLIPEIIKKVQIVKTVQQFKTVKSAKKLILSIINELNQ